MSRARTLVSLAVVVASMMAPVASRAAVLTPQARARHIAFYDPIYRRMIVWGGDNGSTLYGTDVWALSLVPGVTPAWSKLNVTVQGSPGFSPRGAAVVYDSRRHCAYVHGGSDLSNHPLNNLLQLSFPTSTSAVWTALTQEVDPDHLSDLPSPRMYHSMVYDSADDKVFLFGGRDESVRFGGTYVMTPTTDPLRRHWALVTATGGPEPRYGHVSFYDSNRNRMVIMGGVGNSSETTIVPTYALSVGGAVAPSWSQISSFGGPPNLRFASAMYHPAWDHTWIIGGTWIYPWDTYMNAQNNPWLYAFINDPPWYSGWGNDVIEGSTPVTNDVYQTTTVFDPVGNQLIRFGGAQIPFGVVYTDTPTSVLNTTFALSQPQWVPDSRWTQLGTTVNGNKHAASHPITGESPAGSVRVLGGVGSTDVRFRTSNPSRIHIEVLDVQGRLVRGLDAIASTEVVWDVRDASGGTAPAGVYFYRAMVGSMTSSGRVVVTK